MLELNKIYHGDCLEVMKDIYSGSVDMILTDIPYDSVNMKSNGIRTFDKGLADKINFSVAKFVNECCRIANGSVYIFCGNEQFSEIISTFKQNKLSTRVCIYQKRNPPVANGQHLWLSSIELCAFGRKPKSTFNYHCKSSVWDFNIGSSKRHPTEKNLTLFEYLIEASSNKNDTILDPCIGSGTTAVACRNTHRNFIGIEKEEKYVEIANQRILQAEPQLF